MWQKIRVENLFKELRDVKRDFRLIAFLNEENFIGDFNIHKLRQKERGG